ncbi:MAG: preprotein translocase subunit SecG [Spirochaetia bacterium]|nr:preprotein translocase subunit SecG [Spirochaetia bacterium]
MMVLSVIMLVLFVIASLLLILMVLVQDEQGEGLGGIFGGASNTPFGSRSGNVLTKFTSILAAFFLILSLGLAWVNRTVEKDDLLGTVKSAESATATEWWNETSQDKE